MIRDDVVAVVREGRFPLVLTERTDHLARLAELLVDQVQHLVVLRGGLGKKKLRAALAQLAELPDDAGRVLLATGRFLGEGFDEPRLDTLFLTLPVSWRGIIAQYAGRLHRLHDGKREVRVYDYADLEVPMLARMFERRRLGYEAIGYQVRLPASGAPGWPIQVELPVDPAWKDAHSASIRRLLSDGVEPPLAALFRQATGPFSADAEGVDRARSASEAFLYQRLESLPPTAGRFRLNAELPIPFDGRGQMEVDLLDIGARLVIEVDGGQHLTDQQAYRRDRRKDQLLQENGYFVLRFLAEDVGKNFAGVLDAILRVLANLGRRQGPSGPRP